MEILGGRGLSVSQRLPRYSWCLLGDHPLDRVAPRLGRSSEQGVPASVNDGSVAHEDALAMALSLVEEVSLSGHGVHARFRCPRALFPPRGGASLFVAYV